MKRNVIQTIIEAVTYAALAYMTLPSHEQQRLRLVTLRGIQRAAQFVASRAGEIALRSEIAYYQEAGR